MEKNKQPVKKRAFNLLKPEVAPPSAWDKIYDWIVVRSRIAILVCEVIVVLCFAAKVSSDISTKNLNDELKAKSESLGALFATVEPKLRGVQQKADNYEIVWEKSTKYSSILEEIQGYIPNPGVNISITITGTNVTLRGDDNLVLLKEVEAKMKGSKTFKSVSLDLSTEGNQAPNSVGKYVIAAQIIKVENREQIVKAATPNAN